MTSVMLVSADDWQGIYVDGDLVAEGHRIIADIRKMERVFERIDVPSTVYSEQDALFAYLEENGSLPETLNELASGMDIARS